LFCPYDSLPSTKVPSKPPRFTRWWLLLRTRTQKNCEKEKKISAQIDKQRLPEPPWQKSQISVK
jgi:hypothetical protein